MARYAWATPSGIAIPLVTANSHRPRRRNRRMPFAVYIHDLYIGSKLVTNGARDIGGSSRRFASIRKLEERILGRFQARIEIGGSQGGI
jgi:hypothetical protein